MGRVAGGRERALRLESVARVHEAVEDTFEGPQLEFELVSQRDAEGADAPDLRFQSLT